MSKIVKTMHGRVMPLALLVGLIVTVIIAGTLLTTRDGAQHVARAQDYDNATTTVTVLNVPPAWVDNAEEDPASATGSRMDVTATAYPTNVGSTTRWLGKASDDNDGSYYLIICKTNVEPTPASNNPPECNGGPNNRWALSPETPSNQTATATRTAVFEDAESNVWYGWICDDNTLNPDCRGTYTQGPAADFHKSSPFYVNHRPNFTIFIDDSPHDPNQTVRFSTTSTDPDVVIAQDAVMLVVCKAAQFSERGCGSSGIYCASTSVGVFTQHPYCDFALEPVKQDGNYAAYGYVFDDNYFMASGTAMGTDSVLTINNVAPAVSNISLNDTDGAGNLVVYNEAATTNGFTVKYTVTDNNSCARLAGGNEISTALINVFRTGLVGGVAGCDEASEFNANYCYAGSATGSGTWRTVSAQDPNTCSDITDNTADWTSTFTLWYVAQPTDGTSDTDSPWWNEKWETTVMVWDDNSLPSTLAEIAPGSQKEVMPLLAVRIDDYNIPYGGLAPGTNTDPLSVTTVLYATGNVGIDESVSGTPMCVPFPNCSGNPANTIDENNQHYASSVNAFNPVSPPVVNQLTDSAVQLELNGLKSTATAYQQTASTYWGIAVPITITAAGDYSGYNTIFAVASEGTQW